MIKGGVDGGAGSVNYYLDGGNNRTGLRNTGNSAPNPDAVQEFRVITNGYSAEYGCFAGGGSLLARPPLHRNQFGGSVGGNFSVSKTLPTDPISMSSKPMFRTRTTPTRISPRSTTL